jgi:hypothetical protein
MSDQDEAPSYSNNIPGFEGEYDWVGGAPAGRKPYTRTRHTGSILI